MSSTLLHSNTVAVGDVLVTLCDHSGKESTFDEGFRFAALTDMGSGSKIWVFEIQVLQQGIQALNRRLGILLIRYRKPPQGGPIAPWARGLLIIFRATFMGQLMYNHFTCAVRVATASFWDHFHKVVRKALGNCSLGNPSRIPSECERNCRLSATKSTTSPTKAGKGGRIANSLSKHNLAKLANAKNKEMQAHSPFLTVSTFPKNATYNILWYIFQPHLFSMQMLTFPPRWPLQHG